MKKTTAFLFIIILLSIPALSSAQIPIVWDSEYYNVYSYQQYNNGDTSNGEGFNNEAFSAPSILETSLSYPVPVDSSYPQQSSVLARIQDQGSNWWSMTVNTTAADDVVRPEYNFSYALSNAEFYGTFFAQNSVLNIEYNFDYAFSGQGFTEDSYAYNFIWSYIEVMDITDGVTLLSIEPADFVLDFNGINQTSSGDTGSDLFSLPMIPGNEISVWIVLEGDTQADNYANAFADRTLNYRITAAPEPVSSVLFLAGGSLFIFRRLRKKK